jgi:hypothetical protein
MNLGVSNWWLELWTFLADLIAPVGVRTRACVRAHTHTEAYISSGDLWLITSHFPLSGIMFKQNSQTNNHTTLYMGVHDLWSMLRTWTSYRDSEKGPFKLHPVRSL